MSAPLPFSLTVTDSEIDDLRARLARTRWPDQIESSGWDYGTDRSVLQALCEHWRERFDWHAFAARVNAHPQFLTEIDGEQIHYYHLRSPEPQAKPLLLTHGWPGSVAEFFDVLGPLSDPRAHGGDPRDAFHLIVPSLPGYGFSGPTRQRSINGRRIAAMFDQLMQQLGYARYFAQGGDWGSMITVMLGGYYPEHVEAIHLNMLRAPPPNPADPNQGLSPDELQALKRNDLFFEQGSGYQQIQRTRPQTLAYGLSDSPAGLAGWLLDKFCAWSDCKGDVLNSYTYDRLLENISIYWLTGTIGSSMRLYYEEIGPQGRRQPLPPVAVPTGHALFPAEIFYTPRRWAETKFNIRRWQPMPRGGHFAAMEVPDLFVGELREFFRDYR